MAFTPTYICGTCGKKYAKTDSHRCYLDDVERHFTAKIEAQRKLDELTPRMKRRLEFDHWCMENGWL